MEWDAQRGGRFLVDSGNVSYQAGWGSEKSDLVENVLIIAGGLDYMTFKGPFQSKPFCYSTMDRAKRIQATHIQQWQIAFIFQACKLLQPKNGQK